MLDEECRFCLFWRWGFRKEDGTWLDDETLRKAGISTGRCRKSPPQFIKGDRDHDSDWPKTYPNDWCGGFMEA